MQDGNVSNSDDIESVRLIRGPDEKIKETSERIMDSRQLLVT